MKNIYLFLLCFCCVVFTLQAQHLRSSQHPPDYSKLIEELDKNPTERSQKKKRFLSDKAARFSQNSASLNTSAALPTTYGVTWTELKGVMVNANTLTKTGNFGWGTGGAASLNLLPANTDGFVEVTCDGVYSRRAFGLSDVNLDHTQNSIDYCFYMGLGNSVSVYLNGTSALTFATVAGDVLRIQRVGTAMYFKKNGVTMHEVLNAYTGEMVVDATLYETNINYTGIRASFAARTIYDALWTQMQSTGIVSETTLAKTSGGNAWNAGAYSINKLPANTNGWIEYKHDVQQTQKAIGFSDSNIDNHYNTIKYSLGTNSNQVYVRQNGTNLINKAALIGDVFRMERNGSKIYVKQNGILIYTINDVYMGDLYTDAAIYTSTAKLVDVKTSFWIPAEQGQVPDKREIDALRDLYISLNGNNWTHKWPVINWESINLLSELPDLSGVLIRNADITEILLTSNKLSGLFPNSIGNLRALRSLEMGFNQISGSLPESIGNLIDLRVLSIPFNKFSSVLPPTLMKLTKLQSLFLYNNNFTGSLPASLGELLELNYVVISNNHFTGTLPNFSMNEALEDLLVDHNEFTSVGDQPISVGYEFNASHNKLERMPITSIDATRVDLSYNESMEAGPLPKWIAEASYASMYILNLSYTNRTGEFPLWFINETYLLTINLSNNHLSGSIPELIDASYMEDNIWLRDLDLSHNNLTGAIPHWVTSRGKVNLSFNKFSGPLPEFYHGSDGYGRLDKLDVSYNQISGGFPTSIIALRSINHLDISHNQLTGTVPSLGDLKYVYYLNLSYNFFEGAVPYGMSSSIASCPNGCPGRTPIEIDFSYNNFSILSQDFWAVTRVAKTLKADHNKISEIQTPTSSINNNATVYLHDNLLNFENLLRIPNIAQSPNIIYAPQVLIVPTQPIELFQGDQLSMTAPSLTVGTAITWEKQSADQWMNVSNTNQDPSAQTFLRSSVNSSDAGTYRWTMNNASLPGVIVQSVPITVTIVDPPAFSLDDFIFKYRYDGRRRMTHKKVPGADWVYMVYDNRDRLVMTQDGNQRNKTVKEWTFTKYDALNRPILTGIYRDSDNKDQGSMQNDVNGFYSNVPNDEDEKEWFELRGSDVHGYSNHSFPIVASEADYLTVTYYDDYTFPNASSFPYDKDQLVAEGDDVAQEQENFGRVRGQVTGSKIKNLETQTWLSSINYYDDDYRVIQNISQNHKNGIDKVTNVYDFVGKVMRTKTTHNINNNPAISITREFDYDHAGRLLKTWHQIGTTKILLAQNIYNELGQLVTKKLYNTDDESAADQSRVFKEEVSYRYNIRGWLKNINDPENNTGLFNMSLRYNDPTASGGTAQYNGNISEIIWQGADNQKRSYGYYYDTLNRMKEARYFNHTDVTKHNSFNETIGGINTKGYDLNGNILKMHRTGSLGEDSQGVMDDLQYRYTGNQLTRVDDAIVSHEEQSGFKELTKVANEYLYDFNGNMKVDQNKGITAIDYNHLNLPRQVNKGATEYIIYTYDATGRKLSQQVYGTTPKTTDYIGEFIYENDVLQFINHEEGRVVMKDGVAEYQYHLKDHLGNVRLTFTTKEDITSSRATMETAKQSDERLEFGGYDNVRTVNSALFDHTNDKETQYAVRLNGSANEKVGLARSLSVMPGDVIQMEVYGKYIDPEPANWSAALTSLVTSLAAPASANGLVVDGRGYATNGKSAIPFENLLAKGPSSSKGPKAYLNYLVFDRNYKLILKQSGYKRMTEAAKEQGKNITASKTQGVAHEKLSHELTITEPGYVYIYLSNEEETPVEVFFDDFEVEHVKSPVIQAEDYYAFGLTFNSYSRENSVPNYYQYNSKELQDELNLGWLDYGARMYDPTISRWMVIDPLAEKYLSLTPYNYVANIPTVLIDPNGKEIDLSEITDRKERRVVRQALREHKSSGTYKNLYKELKKSENRYVVRTENNVKSYAGATFEANTNMKTEIESESGGTSIFEMQNPATAGSFKADEKGGVLTINTAWVNMDSENDIASVLVEEVVHAAQYENSVGRDKNATTEGGLPGTANTEFEAKAIIGQIQLESKRPLWTNKADAGANAFGVQAFQTKSINGYFGALKQWHSGAYQGTKETNAQPTLLIRLIK